MADQKTVRPLVLAYMVNLYPPYIVGGAEILAQEVIMALRERGHTVHVICGQGKDLPDDGFTHQVMDIDLERKTDIFLGGLPLTVPRLITWHLFNWRTYRGVREALARIQPDLVIGWSLYMASAAPLAAAKRLSIPVIAQPGGQVAALHAQRHQRPDPNHPPALLGWADADATHGATPAQPFRRARLYPGRL